MDETKILEAIQALGAALRTEVADSIDKISKRCDAMADAMAKGAAKKADNEDDDLAEQTAADSMRAEMRVMRDQVNSLVRAQPARRSQGSADAYADAQSKFDVAYVTVGARADAPMSGEDIVAYNIRLARGLQKFSPKWKSAELAHIARDASTFQIALDGIRSDAVQYGLNPPDLKPFEHKMITKAMDTGHIMRTFVGNGTIFAQLSRPVRRVTSIGADDRYPRSAGGSVYAAQ